MSSKSTTNRNNKVAIERKLEVIYSITSCYDFTNNSMSLMGGGTGILVFNFLYCRYKKCKHKNEYNILQQLLLYIGSTQNELLFSFSNGYAGLLWVIKHFEDHFDFAFNIKRERHFLDKQLFNRAIYELKNNNYDFLHGGIGYCLYLLNVEQYQKPILNYVLKLLYPKDVLCLQSDYFYKLFPGSNGSINLGLAHGIASHIAFLSIILKTTSHSLKKYKELLLKTVVFLLNSKNRPVELSIYPERTNQNNANENSRLAWCYGDLGIASSLLQASAVLENNELKQEALNTVLKASTRREYKKNGVIDAGLCHGSAGIAHIFNHFYRETNNMVFKKTADYWIQHTLDLATHPDGLAGYKVWLGKEKGWQNEYGLLEGISGIGLVLLSHIEDEEPTWDRCLLLS